MVYSPNKYRETEGIKVRRLGFDLSKARLEAVALSLGVDKVFDSMTQAEKAQLRYYAIMTQVTTAQGDMARTLDAPANQLRILKAQAIQAARAIGNIFIPVLNAILPYAIAAVKAIRMVASALASLFGFKLPEVDYSGISKIEAGTGGIADNLDKAGGSAKELKKTLLGIDELNVLPEKKAGGGGAGVGGGVDGFDFELPEYDFLAGLTDNRINQVFDAFRPKVEAVVDYIQDHAEQIRSTVKIIGASILAWKVGKSLVNFVNYLRGLAGAKKILAGLTISITGFKMEIDAAADIAKNGLDVMNAIQTALGAALGIGGAVLALGPAGWVLGIGMTLTTFFVGYQVGIDQARLEEFYRTDLGQKVSEIASKTEELATIRLDLKAKIDSITGEISPEAMANLELAKSLISDIFTMDSSENKTAEEIAVIQDKIEVLNKLNLDGLSGIFQTTTDGYILPAADAVQKVIDNLEKQYKMEAMREAYIEAYRLQYEAQQKLAEATDNLSKAQDAYDGVMADAGVYYADYNSAVAGINDILADYGMTLNDLTPASDFWNKATSEEVKVVSDLWVQLGKARKGIIDMKPAVEETGKALADAQDEFDKYSDLAEEASKKVGSIAGELANMVSSLRELDKVGTVKVGVEYSQRYEDRHQAGGFSKVTFRAAGGYVANGELFVAREAGPEMVGSIGNRTAVANNEQIVTAVSSGVYKAVKDAMRESGGNTVITMDGRVIYESVVSRNRDETIRRGENPMMEV